MKTLALTLSVIGSSLLTSCTGDPNSGGIFWSESQAQQRLDDRKQRLDHIEGQTDRTRADSRKKQRQINRLSSEQQQQ